MGDGKSSRTFKEAQATSEDFMMLEQAAEDRAGRRAPFNGRLRDECLNVHRFVSLADARQKIEAWCRDYNQYRPHGALGHLTPSEFVTQRQGTRMAETSAIL